jgi:hypothetical protein
MIPNAFHLSVEEVPIESKYHQSGGKLNIYEEFIDPNHKTLIPQYFKKPLKNKTSNNIVKEKEKEEAGEQKNQKSPK